jgi:oxygen-independent coproporphyrinogen-3 oxidase
MPGVYISWPFCAQKCTYCNFASGVFNGMEAAYEEALAGEMARHSWQWTPDTVYLGGGTPSQPRADLWQRLLPLIPGSPWKEATLETAPGTISAEQIDGWKAAGIDRLSLGVQSFVQREIARTGRKHTAAMVESEIRLLRGSGLSNFNVDLIAGLPGQTAATWQESLDWIERLDPPHVSVYMLEVDEDSRLGKEILVGGTRFGAPDVPSEELTAELYETAVERLATLGIERYEISNFAKPGFESAHNLKYWRREAYAGFGADAHSFDGSNRRRNAEMPAEYIRFQQERGDACVETSRADADEERFFLGLRLVSGVTPEADEWSRFGEPIARFLDAGLLQREGDRLRLTNRGVLLSNEVFQEFLSA